MLHDKVTCPKQGRTVAQVRTETGHGFMEKQGERQRLRGFVVGPGEGRQIKIPYVPEISTIKAGAADTGGTISVHEQWHGPDDTGVPRHFHHELVEMYYVLEGDMRFLLGEEEIVAG